MQNSMGECRRAIRATNKSVKWRIAATLERYLGQQAASAILLSVSEEGDNLLSSIEPVLALLPGENGCVPAGQQSREYRDCAPVQLGIMRP